MTPIESIYDHRLVVLLNMTIGLIEDAAIREGTLPELILAERLLRETNKLLRGTEPLPLDCAKKHYPMLIESLQ
jgi:hypothetical protein